MRAGHAGASARGIQPIWRRAVGCRILPAEETENPVRSILRAGSHELPLGERTYLMAILNLTSDSFSGDGLLANLRAVPERAETALAEGADILDIGGETARTNRPPVPVDEEIRRVVPVIEELRATTSAPLSINTFRTGVTAAALEAGADMVNDMSGAADPELLETVASSSAAFVIMHIRGRVKERQVDPKYEDLMDEIMRFFETRLDAAMRAGIDASRLVLDPGIDFAKTPQQSLTVLRRFREFSRLGLPLLAAVSRKTVIGDILGLPADRRDVGTAACVAVAIDAGADIIRVHAVRPMSDAARMADALCREG